MKTTLKIISSFKKIITGVFSLGHAKNVLFYLFRKKGQAFLYHVFHEVLLNIPILEFELFVLVKKLVFEQQDYTNFILCLWRHLHMYLFTVKDLPSLRFFC